MDTNHKFLNCLQDDARVTVTELSKRLFLSKGAISQKLHKYERDQVITGYLTKVNTEKLGYHLKTYLFIKPTVGQEPALQAFIQDAGNVVWADTVTGDYSVMICCYFKETQNLEDFIQELQHFGRTKTQVAFSNLVPLRGIRLDEAE